MLGTAFLIAMSTHGTCSFKERLSFGSWFQSMVDWVHFLEPELKQSTIVAGTRKSEADHLMVVKKQREGAREQGWGQSVILKDRILETYPMIEPTPLSFSLLWNTGTLIGVQVFSKWAFQIQSMMLTHCSIEKSEVLHYLPLYGSAVTEDYPDALCLKVSESNYSVQKASKCVWMNSFLMSISPGRDAQKIFCGRSYHILHVYLLGLPEPFLDFLRLSSISAHGDQGHLGLETTQWIISF